MSQHTEPGMPKGSKRNGAGSKWTPYSRREAKQKIAWDEVSAPQIGEVVAAVTRDGSAVLFGTTRDGGALVVTICAGDERIKFYASDPQEVADMIANIIATAES